MRDMVNGWAVVLAGGDGARLHALTTTRAGLVIPKQYCSLGRSDCLIQDATKRAQSIVAPSHVAAVVATQHRRWWKPALANVPDANVFVQPANKGTALGILFALVKIRRNNPAAIVTLLPADHYFRDETTLIRVLRTTANLASENPASTYLLGTEPEGADGELGYILPAERAKGTATPVIGFSEKPDAAYAQELVALGALWNLFILVGSVGALLELFRESFTREWVAMTAAIEADAAGDARALEALYESAVTIDFSRDILELQASRLQVMRVANCGWTDLGTPQRVETTVRNLSSIAGIGGAIGKPPAPLFFDLCDAC